MMQARSLTHVFQDVVLTSFEYVLWGEEALSGGGKCMLSRS